MTSAPSNNFRLLLLSGGGYFMALQAGNPNFVLPWISTHLGATAILVVLIVPMVQIGRVVTELLLGPKLTALSFRKGVHTASLLGLAVSMMLAAFAAGILPPQLLGWAILVCAFGNGVCTGGYQVANQDLLAKTISPAERGKLLARRVALGGVLAIVMSLLYQRLAPDKAHNTVLALWVAVAAWALAAAVSSLVHEDPGTSRPQQIAVLIALNVLAAMYAGKYLRLGSDQGRR
jgi:MFS family permease